MIASEPAPALEQVGPRSGDARYEVFEEIGRGGLARVYRALDRVSGEQVALKRLIAHADQGRAARAQALFEREFHLLSQLSHPRIVQAYDYQVDESGPFYTMELLDGGDLREVAPVPFERACALIRDACSGLSLIHSRRIVHRDISPRNIRVAADGSAKLIDFGAIAPMGPGRDAIGTPPNCPPEVLDRDTLDARSDLYSMGTALYYALCGRNAYPARDFRHLRRLWREPALPPSHFVPGLPAALDELVMELIALDPAKRPDSAAEVMARLTAIADLPESEVALVPRAYLKTPVLVGRKRPLARMQARMAHAREGEGGAALLSSPAGVGRTRFIDACAVRAKLLGLSVLRTGQADAHAGDYGAARALLQQAFDAYPDQAERLVGEGAQALALLLPDGAIAADDVVSAAFSRLQVQSAARAFFLALSAVRPLAIIADDLERLDEPSAALLSLLAESAPGRPLFIIAAATTEALATPNPGLRLYADCSAPVRLSPLKAGETRALLSSVFGDVPNLDGVAEHLHRVAEGTPRDVMHLVEHLVEHGIARYEAGAWQLPPKLDPADVPASLARAFQARVADLSRAASRVGSVFALTPDDAWDVLGVQRILGDQRGAAVMLALDELVEDQIVRVAGGAYRLSQPAFVAPLSETLGAHARKALHLRIADEFERIGDAFRSIQHRLRGGEHQRALDAFVPYARASKVETSADVGAYHRFLRDLPRDYEDTYRQALALCESLGRPAADGYAIRARLATAVTAKGGRAWDLFDTAIGTCVHDAGLDLLRAQPPELAPGERLSAAMEAAARRRDALGEGGSVFEPKEALRPLASLVVEALGVVSNNFDRAAWETLPDLSPLSAVSPVFSVMNTVSRGMGERLAGRILAATALYSEMLARLDGPDHGLEASHYHGTRDGMLFVRGMLRDLVGEGGAEQDAALLDESQIHSLGSRQLRMVHHLWQGDGETADRLRRELEVEQVQSHVALRNEGVMLLSELAAVCISDDYPRLRRLMPDIERYAASYRGWRPVLHFARGERYRITGDAAKALSEHRKGLALARPGHDQLWACLAGSEVRCMLKLGQIEDAVARGRHYQEMCQQNGLSGMCQYVRLPLAVALSEAGEIAEGLTLAGEVLDALERRGCSGVLLSLAHQVLARIHLRAEDRAAFDAAVSRADEVLTGATTRSLEKRQRQLRQLAERRTRTTAGVKPVLAGLDPYGAATSQYITSVFDGCDSVERGAQHTAELLAGFCRASEVHLYIPSNNDHMTLGASVGAAAPPDLLSEFVSDFLHAECAGAEMTNTASDEQAPDSADTSDHFVSEDGRRYQPVLLAHHESTGFSITGIAMVAGAEVDPNPLAASLSRLGLGTVLEAPRTVMTTHLLDA